MSFFLLVKSGSSYWSNHQPILLLKDHRPFCCRHLRPVTRCRFCSRLGFRDDIEVAEEKRARRRGIARATDLRSLEKAWVDD